MSVKEYFNRGASLINEGEYDMAIKTLNRALAKHPDELQLLEIRALAYFLKGEKEKALADFTRMVIIAPDKPNGWKNRGDAYLDRGEPDKALVNYTQSLALAPDEDVLFNRGSLYARTGDYGKAIADYTQCIALSPEGDGTYGERRGYTYFEKGDLNAALADANKAIACWKDTKDSDKALTTRGFVWRDLGKPDKALEDFTLAAAYNPKNFDALFRAGCIWTQRQDFEKAIELFSKALEAYEQVETLLPDHPRVVEERAKLRKSGE
jgi:tetratricopeptide (TPR) repeat protein